MCSLEVTFLRLWTQEKYRSRDGVPDADSKEIWNPREKTPQSDPCINTALRRPLEFIDESIHTPQTEPGEHLGFDIS